ncbi:serine/threonine-protein kinase 52-like [Bidens hawaiensis]|uniref:serine/threonine-protein kinase 52-like n=1 Tax=Bidens hawaiensis TaxID=980011 RepID=UPI00404B6E10
MEAPQRVVDVMMNLQIAHNRLLGSPNSWQNQFNQVLSRDQDRMITHQHHQWQDTIDPLKLVCGKVIGRGSFGVVHKGSYKGQTVAVKILDFGNTRVTKAMMECMKNDFMKEACLWQHLDHPNVTKMIGATMSMKTNSSNKNKKSKTESNCCIVSELVKGGSLRSYLFKNREKKLHLKTVIQFALDIANGLSYLHSKKIIHRDVKPDNILIDNNNKIKLADFGESVYEPLELFIMSDEIGTWGYMAPEVVSRKPYGHKCDVYGFGICLWEIYCCDVAYTYDLENIPANIYKDIRPTIPVNCPRSLARLIEQCWDTDPKKRSEMKDVVVELEDIIKSEGWQTSSTNHNGPYDCFGFFSCVGMYMYMDEDEYDEEDGSHLDDGENDGSGKGASGKDDVGDRFGSGRVHRSACVLLDQKLDGDWITFSMLPHSVLREMFSIFRTRWIWDP